MKILTPVFINNENYITGHISHAANDKNEILCKTSFKTGFRRLPPVWKIEEGNPNCVHCLRLLRGLKCPKCGSAKVRKNGKKGETQYYACVQCHCRFLEKVEIRDSCIEEGIDR